MLSVYDQHICIGGLSLFGGSAMAHHRCTRCKEESAPRHKYVGGLFCESCLRALGVHGFRHFSIRGFWSNLWDKIGTWVSAPFRGKKKVSPLQLAAVRFNVRYQAMRSAMLRIPPNVESSAPQKR